ncbi:MAG: fimbria major subunit [Tannerellaceae bacterium]|nr:fimbria major subunit [Tannerellaceae bacterium]
MLAIQNNYINNSSLIRTTAQSEKLKFDDLSAIVGAYNSTTYTDEGIVYFENEPNATASSSTTPIPGSNRGFMMTPPDGMIERYLPETADGAFHPINIEVGRAMAKVSLGSNLVPNDDITQPAGNLDVWSYKIVNNPKEMFIMTNWSSSSFITPYFSDQTVDVTKYFESENKIDEAAALAAGLTQAELDDLEENYMPASVDGRKTFTYCIENANLTPKQGNSTAAIVKGKFEPKATLLCDPTDPTNQTVSPNSDGTFWRIWIPEYENAQQEKAGDVYDDRYFTADPTTELANLGLPANALTAIDPDTDIKEYPEGICYYGVWLYNDQNDDQPWGVKRNKYYMVDIISVSGAGEPDEGNVIDPEIPLEEQTDIKVKITVLDWEGIPQGGAL